MYVCAVCAVLCCVPSTYRHVHPYPSTHRIPHHQCTRHSKPPRKSSISDDADAEAAPPPPKMNLDAVFRAAPANIQNLRLPLLEIGGLPPDAGSKAVLLNFLVDAVPELGAWAGLWVWVCFVGVGVGGWMGIRLQRG